MRIAKQFIWIAPLGFLVAGCNAPVRQDTTVAQWQNEYQLPATGRQTQRVYAYPQTQSYPAVPKVVVDSSRKEGSQGDFVLANNIRERLEYDRTLSPSLQNTTIVVRDGWVTLRGTVRSDLDARLAVDTLRDMTGVRHVKNELVIAANS
jgi:osmotically-inducible protein OsmY